MAVTRVDDPTCYEVLTPVEHAFYQAHRAGYVYPYAPGYEPPPPRQPRQAPAPDPYDHWHQPLVSQAERDRQAARDAIEAFAERQVACYDCAGSPPLMRAWQTFTDMDETPLLGYRPRTAA